MSRAALCCTVCCAAWLSFDPSAARAQDLYLKEDRPFNSERQEALKAGLAADPGPPSEAQVQAAEIGARFLVYRITDPRVRENKVPGTITTVINQFEHWLGQIFRSPEVKNPEMQVIVRKKLLEALGNVLAPDNQLNITRANATRMLARLAAVSGHEETADLLVKVLTDPKQVDGARYWALKGLKELLLRAYQKPPTVVPVVKDARRREKIAEALVQFIERKPVLEKKPSEPELEGLQVVRREAIRALALLPEPLYAGNPKAHSALALLRVLRKDKELVPEPRLDEQVEAAIGLAQMRADAKSDYQPGYVAHHLASFLVDLGAQHANRSATRLGGRMPWKVFGARLQDALKGMQAAFPTDPTVKGVAPLAIQLADSIERQPTSTPAKREALATQWLMAHPQPPQPSVYKGDPKATVEPRGGARE